MLTNKQAKREAKQLFHFCRADGFIDENRVRQVASYITTAGYRDCPAILSHFLRLVKLDRLQHTARIESATPLTPDLQFNVESDLTRMYGPGLTTLFTHRPSLIGGMRIQVGSDVYDGSVLGALSALEKSF